MNGTQLLQFRVAEELRELERIWGLLDTSASNLARARYTSFNSKYSERKRELNELLKFAADAPPWRKYGNAVKAARHLERRSCRPGSAHPERTRPTLRAEAP